MTAVEASSIEGIDLDAVVPCQGKACDQPAVLRLVTRCCSATSLACTTCRDVERVKIARRLFFGSIRCGVCKVLITDWPTFIREVPL